MKPRKYKRCPHCNEWFLRQHRARWQWKWSFHDQSVTRQYCLDTEWSPSLTRQRYDQHVEECLSKRLEIEYGSSNPLRERPWEQIPANSRTPTRKD